jgi:hypothetical protein
VPETVCETQTVTCVRKECFTVCKQVPETRTICEPVTVKRQVTEYRNVCVPKTVCRQVPVEVCVKVPVTVQCPPVVLPSAQGLLASPQTGIPLTATPPCDTCDGDYPLFGGLLKKTRRL